MNKVTFWLFFTRLYLKRKPIREYLFLPAVLVVSLLYIAFYAGSSMRTTDPWTYWWCGGLAVFCACVSGLMSVWWPLDSWKSFRGQQDRKHTEYLEDVLKDALREMDLRLGRPNIALKEAAEVQKAAARLLSFPGASYSQSYLDDLVGSTGLYGALEAAKVHFVLEEIITAGYFERTVGIEYEFNNRVITLKPPFEVIYSIHI